MLILCPGCLTVFRIQAAQLNAAAGRIRCAQCGEEYLAAGHLYDQVLDAQAARLARVRERAQVAADELQSAAETHAPGRDAALDNAVVPQAAGHSETVETTSLPPLPGDDWDAFGQPPLEREEPRVTAQTQEDLSESVRLQIEAALMAELEEVPPRRISGRTWLGLAAAVVLVLLLVGQFLYVQRAQWLDDPRWRPWADRLCATLGCQLPLRRDISLIELVEREVRDHPQVEDAVLISATFVNRAPFVQPYPVFEVVFSDLSGTQVAVRRFDPQEYLQDAQTLSAGLIPDQPVHVRLEVLDPGRRAVSFKLEFL